MEDVDALPVYTSHDSAVLPAKQDLSRDETPSSRSVDPIEQQLGTVYKDPIGTRLTEFDMFRHGRLKPWDGRKVPDR